MVNSVRGESRHNMTKVLDGGEKMTNQTRGAVANRCKAAASLLWSPTPTGSNLKPFHFLFLYI